MGVYYYLLNDTKREKVHVGAYVKRGPLAYNSAVHFALCNYMLMNLGDTLRMCGDPEEEIESYAEVNLLSYKFDDPEVAPKILELLNTIYGGSRYDPDNS